MFKVIIPKHALKELSSINKTDRQLVFDKIKDLKNGLFSNDKALKGKHKGKYRKRAGNYRIVYLKENDVLVITVVRIAHRKEVFKLITKQK
jgi:mRNA interferase RelE/StbE